MMSLAASISEKKKALNFLITKNKHNLALIYIILNIE